MKRAIFNVPLGLIALVAAAPREKPEPNGITPLSGRTLFANPLTARQGLETQLTHCTNELPNECGKFYMKDGGNGPILTGCGSIPDKGISSFKVNNCYCTFWA
jgi:hypothetical protein